MRVNLDTLHRVTTKNLKAIKQQLTKERPDPWKGSFTLVGISYEITCDLDDQGHAKNDGFLLEWTSDDGRRRRQRIGVTFKPCNLDGITSPCMYFICPYKGVLCRKLYTDGDKFFSRQALTNGFIYSSQKRTPRQKERHTPTIPNQRNRKTTYKGKQTPFGRQLQKAIEQDERAENALMLYGARLLCQTYKRRFSL